MDTLKLTRFMRKLDYAVGAGTVGYGLYATEPLIIGLGIAGLALAHLNLSDRISAKVRKHFGRKNAKAAPAPEPELESVVTERTQLPVPAVSYAQTRLQVGQDLSSASRHSILKGANHLNHA